MQVIVYGRPDRVCYKCRATKRWLKEHGIEFQPINVDQDAEAHNLLAEIGALEVPVVMWSDDHGEGWWSGHRIPMLEDLVKRLAPAGDAA